MARKHKFDTLVVWLRTLSLSDWLVGISILAAVTMRFSFLSTAPYGMDADQSIILYWAQKNWENFDFALYGDEFTHWELLPGYIYYIFFKISDSYRFGPALIGIIEALLMFKVAESLKFSKREALVASALLLCSPWHFYFSRIVGTCFGLSAIWMLTILVQQKWLKATLDVLGFFYYTAYRVVILGRFLQAARNPKKEASYFILTLTLIAGLLSVMQEWPSVISRGSHLFEEDKYPFAWSYLSAFLIWFGPSLSNWVPSLESIMEIDISQALVESIGIIETPMGWTVSALGFLGLVSFLKKIKNAEASENEKFILSLFGLGLIFIGFSASYSHYVFLVPAFVIFALRGWTHLKNLQMKRWVLFLALMESLTLSGKLLHHLEKGNFSNDIFSDRVRSLSEQVENLTFKVSPQATQIITAHTLIEARFWAQQFKTFFPISPMPRPAAKMHFLESPKDQGTQVLIFEDPDLAHIPKYRSDMLEALQTYKEMIDLVQSEAQVLQSQDLKFRGLKIGTAYLVRWP